jgi:predicted aspartyl protease
VRRALLDTGADDTVFHDSLAAVLGVDLTNAPSVPVNVATAGGVVPVRFAPVTLRLTDGSTMREWPAVVGFTSAPLISSLLGFSGCLQFFDATFRGALEMVELTTKALYPGT